MNTELVVLRALFRLSRRAAPTEMQRIVACVREGDVEVQRALGALAGEGLVQRAGESVRLTLSGLAVVVAAEARREARRVDALAPRACVIPIVRRRRRVAA